jgi:prepilin-type N-terminal cleavage/methylation domain-containing protein
MRLSKRGYTLVEIMIVVGIVAVLITLVVPNILRSRSVANEAAAISNLKIISNACQLFHIGQDRYPSALTELSTATPPYIDSVLAGGNKQGYDFIYSTTSDGYSINANPSGILGGRYFYVDQTDTVHVKSGGTAGPDDEIIR